MSTLSGSEQHVRLDALLQQLRAQVLTDDPRSVCAYWGPFDRQLRDHFDWEENHLLSEFARAHPDDPTMVL